MAQYGATPGATPMRTPRTPAGRNVVMEEARNLLAMRDEQTPLKVRWHAWLWLSRLHSHGMVGHLLSPVPVLYRVVRALPWSAVPATPASLQCTASRPRPTCWLLQRPHVPVLVPVLAARPP